MNSRKPFYAVSFLLIFVAILFVVKAAVLPQFFSVPGTTEAVRDFVPEASQAPVLESPRTTDQTGGHQVTTQAETVSIPATPAPTTVEQKQDLLWSNPPKAELELRGTITGPTQIASAFITDKVTGSTGTYKIGDRVGGGRLVAIEKEGVLIDYDGQTINLESKTPDPSMQHVERDVSSVSFQGDSTLMGMRIENSDIGAGIFSVSTTGARFEYELGQLKIFQGPDPNDQRLLSVITLENEPIFTNVETNEDHILFWSPSINLGIYGDSTGIIAPKTKQYLKCRGHFRPDYEGRHEGELLLIDDKGGMAIYPQRYETGYTVEKIELGPENWLVDYKLNAGERVMLAAFPGRTFDGESSLTERIIVTHGSQDAGNYGEMPPESAIEGWAANFDTAVLFYEGLYQRTAQGENYNYGPYIVEKKREFTRLVNDIHEHNMKIATYVSLGSYYLQNGTKDGFMEQITALRDQYGIDGVYIDSLTSDGWQSRMLNNILNWETVRQLRELFGPEGVIIRHETQIRAGLLPETYQAHPITTVPNIDGYCTATINEGLAPDGVEPDYSLPDWIEREGIRAVFMYLFKGNQALIPPYVNAANNLGLNTAIVYGCSFAETPTNLRNYREWLRLCNQAGLHVFAFYPWQPPVGNPCRPVVFSDGAEGLFPCPLDDKLWHDYLTADMVGKLAGLSIEGPQTKFDGYFLDMEMYGTEKQPETKKHYSFDTCYCDFCFSTFILKGTQLKNVPPVSKDGRKSWLEQNGYLPDYHAFLAAEVEKKAEELKNSVRAVNPRLLFGVYPAITDTNWVRTAVMRALGRDSYPVISFTTDTYGYFGNRARPGSWGAERIPADLDGYFAKYDINGSYAAGYLFKAYTSSEIKDHLIKSIERAQGYWLFRISQLVDDYLPEYDRLAGGTQAEYIQAIKEANSYIRKP